MVPVMAVVLAVMLELIGDGRLCDVAADWGKPLGALYEGAEVRPRPDSLMRSKSDGRSPKRLARFRCTCK